MTNHVQTSPISNTGNAIWDDTFNACFYQNMSTFLWQHHCMFNGIHFVGKDEECSWCGAVEENEENVSGTKE